MMALQLERTFTTQLYRNHNLLARLQIAEEVDIITRGARIAPSLTRVSSSSSEDEIVSIVFSCLIFVSLFHLLKELHVRMKVIRLIFVVYLITIK